MRHGANYGLIRKVPSGYYSATDVADMTRSCVFMRALRSRRALQNMAISSCHRTQSRFQPPQSPSLPSNLDAHERRQYAPSQHVVCSAPAPPKSQTTPPCASARASTAVQVECHSGPSGSFAILLRRALTRGRRRSTAPSAARRSTRRRTRSKRRLHRSARRLTSRRSP